MIHHHQHDESEFGCSSYMIVDLGLGPEGCAQGPKE